MPKMLVLLCDKCGLEGPLVAECSDCGDMFCEDCVGGGCDECDEEDEEDEGDSDDKPLVLLAGTRYRTYTRGEESPLRIAIHPDEWAMNPDPDGRHSRLLKLGWTCDLVVRKIDPIPGPGDRQARP